MHPVEIQARRIATITQPTMIVRNIVQPLMCQVTMKHLIMIRQGSTDCKNVTIGIYSCRAKSICLAYDLNSPWIPEKPTTGIQFVKPRIYQTGGGEWKSVNYENPEDLSLKQKLKMLGIDHEEGTKERFYFLARCNIDDVDSPMLINP